MAKSLEERILNRLINTGSTYRAVLSRELAVSRTAISNVTNSLIKRGILSVKPPAPNEDPRALKNELRIDPSNGIFAAIVVRNQSADVCLACLTGELITDYSFDFPFTASRKNVLTKATTILLTLRDRLPKHPRIRGCYLAVDTQCDQSSGEVLSTRASKKWASINPKKLVQQALGCPVTLQNTARLLAFTEWLADAESKNLCLVWIDHGIGMGQIIDGDIFVGSRGASGELGHTIYDHSGPLCSCGNRGCLMGYVSIPALSRHFSHSDPYDLTSFSAISQRAANGDPQVIDTFIDAGRVLGNALVNVCHLIAPDRLIIGGEVAQAGAPFLQPIRDELHAHCLPLVTRNLEIRQAHDSFENEKVARAAITHLRKNRRFSKQVARELL